ncbi:tail fiber assembly protein [Chromobacterium violaceum]|uniref:tail fiber assembly protein n=1 Tax=Chromobacterium violaceum TaxID=536 RepID=UPI001C8B6D1F|nr:tail fiber assembly protein [Chromobacterium violaceum]MBX9268737.1 tail fiber assembly protein [Chromobacterium violaceum]
MTDTKIVYSYHPQTGEYLGITIADRSPLDVEEVWLLPAYSTELQPPAASTREAAVFEGGRWAVKADWRAVKLWSVKTAQPIQARLGDTPDSLSATEQQPPPFGVWRGGRWVVDEAAERAAIAGMTDAEIAARRAQADAAVVPLHDAAELGIATPAETALLTAWKRYRVELSRVPAQQGYPSDIKWPQKPA